MAMVCWAGVHSDGDRVVDLDAGNEYVSEDVGGVLREDTGNMALLWVEDANAAAIGLDAAAEAFMAMDVDKGNKSSGAYDAT